MRISDWSADVCSSDLEFYFKGESAGRVWLSPHDETPTGAHDAAPDEMDVAIAIERMQSVVDWPVAAVERKWAGLRSFAPDRIPVFGPDHEEGIGRAHVSTTVTNAHLVCRLLLEKKQI